jgi:TonB family protein
MLEVLPPSPAAANPQPAPVPGLLVELPPWRQVFLENLGDLVRPKTKPPLVLQSSPGAFWPDVFVERDLPWRRFIESTGYHILATALLVLMLRFVAMHPQPAPRSTFDHAQVIYYQPSEYLPPIDTRSSRSNRTQKADPEFSRQPVISVPREADNRSQTIVTPPNIKLKHDVPLPNIVAWSNQPELPIAPAPLIPASNLTRITPQLENAVVAPPPETARISRRRDLPSMQTSVVAPPPDVRAPDASASFQALQPAVIAPPPSVENAYSRPPGELNVGRSAVIAPAPQLALGEQRAIPQGRSASQGIATQVVPPPPSMSGSGSTAAGGRVIALNLHPAVGAPPTPPEGNRRGTFAATPEGRSGASGDPGASAIKDSGGHGTGSATGGGNGSGKSGKSDLPSGLYVGSTASPAKTSPVAGDPGPKTTASANTVNPRLMGSIPPTRVPAAPARSLQPGNEASLSEAERSVFGSRTFYSLTLNMPNLNSAGGSWVIRFAELKKDSSAGAKPEPLSAPAATRKVDPAYPLQLMRENVSGTVTLYAVIRADGTVGNVRVLNGIDDRLDQYAIQAVAQWHFQPAMKNGSPVDVEATFRIPFRPQRPNF